MNKEKVQQDLLEKIADLIEEDSGLSIAEKLGVLSILQFSLIASAGGLVK
jgi:hypothetical protein